MDELTRALTDAAAGDRAAVTRLVRGTQADLWRFCAHLVDTGAADDLTQEVYARALGAASTFRGDGSARGWLFGIARRVAADELRRRRREPRQTAGDPGEDARPAWSDRTVDPTAAHDPVAEDALTSLVGDLDEERRVAFVLTQLLGWSYAEAAEACEVPVGTIRSRVARARAQLVTALDGSERATGS